MFVNCGRFRKTWADIGEKCRYWLRIMGDFDGLAKFDVYIY
jgi:hypothetical protein